MSIKFHDSTLAAYPLLALIMHHMHGGLNPPHTHFQLNAGKTNSVAFASLNSQNPGVITIANAVFGSDPPINPDVLAKACQLDEKGVVSYLQNQF
ncbi:hypothetical protein NC652_040783 [Populus alba x Populus x berolinensis]|nr:hypothetical protein NC652_040783 [Populus alba x Populus x berolinensis]